MAKKRTKSDGFGVSLCSLCDAATLVVGQQKLGGVRYCEDCIKHTLAWFQLTPELQEKTSEAFARMRALPTTQALLAVTANVSESSRKAMAIGESRRRLIESER